MRARLFLIPLLLGGLTGCQSFKERLFSPLTKRLDLVNSQLTETNRHAGHADILREQLDGAVGTVAGCTALHGRDATFWENYRAKIERAAKAADPAQP